jgi:signal transduction histidine kinase
MTLQQKFFLVVSMLTLALLGSLGAVWWAFAMLQRELATPFGETTALLDALRQVKRNTEDQSAILHAHGASPVDPVPPPTSPQPSQSSPSADPGPDVDPASPHPSASSGPPEPAPSSPPAAQPSLTPSVVTDIQVGRWSVPRPYDPSPEQVLQFRRLAQETLASLDRIDALDMATARVGVGTWRNLRGRVRDIDTLLAAWTRGNDPTAQARAADACFAIHELIERTEGQILTAARSSVTYGDWVRGRLLAWLASVFAAGVLGSILSIALLRRWVQSPVRALREAASRIATGDFQHRVPVMQRDELGLLSAEVNHMAQMVQVMQDERVDRERLAAIGEVMRRVVHNVRNPLAGIRGLAEVTRLDFDAGSPNRENMDMIVSTVDTFERWLSELLDATSPATIEPREADVRQWLRGIIEIHRSQAAARNVSVHLDDARAPDAATFDPKHMDHALSALVSNAIEASPVPGDVWVTARVAADDERCWEVRVADRGPGVPPEVLPRIFQPNFTTKRRGSGLGLAMAAQIVKGHHGKISVANGDPEHPERTGARFVMRLPVHMDHPNTNQSAR